MDMGVSVPMQPRRLSIPCSCLSHVTNMPLPHGNERHASNGLPLVRARVEPSAPCLLRHRDGLRCSPVEDATVRYPLPHQQKLPQLVSLTLDALAREAQARRIDPEYDPYVTDLADRIQRLLRSPNTKSESRLGARRKTRALLDRGYHHRCRRARHRRHPVALGFGSSSR